MQSEYVTPGLTVISLLLVAYQLHRANKQREMDSLAKIIETNRQLVILAFSHPDLLPVLKDEKSAKPDWERFYLQLWLNEFSMAHAFIGHSFFRRERRENLVRGITEFMGMKNMQRHWINEGNTYPVSFQTFVNNIIKKIEPPQDEDAAAQVSAS